MSPGAAAAAPPSEARRHPAPPAAGTRALGAELARCRARAGRERRPRPPRAARPALKLREQRPWSPPVRVPRGSTAGVRARGAEPWGAGRALRHGTRLAGRCGLGAQGPRREAAPAASLSSAPGPSTSQGCFLHSSAVRQPPPLPRLRDARVAAPAAVGRGAGGRRFKMEMRAGAGRGGRAEADVRRLRAARTAGPAGPGSAEAAASAAEGRPKRWGGSPARSGSAPSSKPILLSPGPAARSSEASAISVKLRK